MTQIRQRPPEVAKEVLRYFLRNADATDDLEGIVRFRLLEQRLFRDVSEVQEALEWLVSAGLLLQHATVSGGSVFSLNNAERGEAEKFVQGDPSDKP